MTIDVLTVGRALAVVSVGWAALFSVAHSDVSIPTTETYPTCGIITEIDEANDLVVYADYPTYTNEWDFKGIEDYAVDDIIALTMDTKGTTSIYDDEPVQIRYCGHKGE